MERKIEMKRAIGWIPRLRKPVWMTAVMLDGRTMRQFLHPIDAQEYADELRKKYPSRIHG